MTSSNSIEPSTKQFTLEEANKTLPLVRAIVTDIVSQFQAVDQLRQRLAAIAHRGQPRASKDDPYAEEIAQTRSELDREELRLREFVEELSRLGVELKGPDGLCDFPSELDGRPIYLCWRLGEPTIDFWHELNTGFAGRQPLAPSRSTKHCSH